MLEVNWDGGRGSRAVTSAGSDAEAGPPFCLCLSRIYLDSLGVYFPICNLKKVYRLSRRRTLEGNLEDIGTDTAI